MNFKAHLQKVYQFNQGIIKKQVEDISEDESLIVTADLINHIRWQIGHIAFYANDVNRLLGGEADYPEKWEHFKGGEPLKEADWYPSLADIGKKLSSLYDQINASLEKIDEATMDDEIQLYPEWKASRSEGTMFLITHEMYHSGQITIIRKSLGKPTMG